MPLISHDCIYKDLLTPFHHIHTFDNNNSIYLGSQSAVGGFPDKWNYTDKCTFGAVLEQLKKYNIKYIVCCAELYDLFDELEYLHIPMESNDNFNIKPSVLKAHKFIDDKIENGSILVHCNAGCHRSATIVTSYLMKKLNWDVDTAHNYIKSKRSCVDISNFKIQLEKLELK
jgi:protein-tyrosine phosphatase